MLKHKRDVSWPTLSDDPPLTRTFTASGASASGSGVFSGVPQDSGSGSGRKRGWGWKARQGVGRERSQFDAPGYCPAALGLLRADSCVHGPPYPLLHSSSWLGVI